MDSNTYNIRCLRFINQNVAYYDFKMCRIPQHLAKSNKYCDSACPLFRRNNNKLRFSKTLNTSGKNIFQLKENHYSYTVKIDGRNRLLEYIMYNDQYSICADK